MYLKKNHKINVMLKYLIFFGLLFSGPFLFSQINFSESSSNEIVGVWYFGTIDFADIDGDNDLDLLIGGEDNNNNVVTKLYINDGSSIFTEIADNPLAFYYQGNSNFADIDGDGDEDIFLAGSWGGKARMYKNNGLGIFTEIVDGPFISFSYNANVFFDIDNDSDLDLLISGRRDSDLSPFTRLYENDGVGNYSLVSGTQFDNLRRSTAAHADVDGDNDLDLIIAGENNADISITKLYLNDGMGSFTLAANNPFHGIVNGSIKFTDVDNDSDQDVFITGSSKSRLYINDGQGNFTEKLNTTFSGSRMDIADIDGDGDTDILYLGTTECTLYTNDGNGNFEEILNTPFKATFFGNVKFADVDGDNDPDILITGRDAETDSITTRLYINNIALSSVLNPSTIEVPALNIFPNPSTFQELYVKFNFLKNTQANIKVFNIYGKLVMSEERSIFDYEEIISINIGNLTAGKYIMKMEQGTQSAYGKFIKKN